MKTKQLHSAAVKGQAGVNLIERVVLDMKSRWTPNGPNEVGIDGFIELFDPTTGKATGKNIAVQSKALSTLCRQGPDTIEYWCDRRDIEYWLRQNLPVILVVSKPDASEAYWACIQDRFPDYSRHVSPKIQFSAKDDVFSASAWAALCSLGAPKTGGKTYIEACQPGTERVVSNLLPLSRCSDTIYHGMTDMRYPGDVWRSLRDAADFNDGAWVLHDRGIFSFADLGTPEWNAICDRGTVEPFDTAEWADSSDADDQRLFVQLLNRALQSQLSPRVRFWPKQDCFAVVGGPWSGPVVYPYQSAKKKSHITVVEEFSHDSADGRTFVHYRHLAFRRRFRKLQGRWHLEVTPTYRFTRDGNWLYRFHEDQLKGIKRIEGNRAVLSQVLVWAEFLCEKDALWASSPRHLEFERPIEVELPAMLRDSAWGKPPRPSGDDSEDGIMEFPFGDEVMP